MRLERLVHVVFAANACEFYQHGKIDPGDDFDIAVVHDGDGKIGRCATEHIRQNNDAISIIDARNGVDDILPALIHVVFGTDTNRLDQFLGTDDMLQRMAKLSASLPWVTSTSPIMKCSLAHALSLPTIATRQSCPSVGFHLDEENANRKPKIA